MILSLGSSSWTLLPERAVWHEETRTLVVADVHVGKSATFRARGVPVPEGETPEDLRRLKDLATRSGARRLIVAGDLFHAPEACHRLADLESWLHELAATTTEVVLIEGNHDRKARALSEQLGLSPRARLRLGGLVLCHDPGDLPDGQPGLAGHLHPGVRLPNGPRHTLRVPCFWLRHGRHLILPSFGTFTGAVAVEPKSGDRVFLPSRDRVAEWPVG